MSETWDVALSRRSKDDDKPQRNIVFPQALSRAFNEAGYTRCRLELRPDGLLLIPYNGGESGRDPTTARDGLDS